MLRGTGQGRLGALPAWLLRPLLRLAAIVTTDSGVGLHGIGLPREALGSAIKAYMADSLAFEAALDTRTLQRPSPERCGPRAPASAQQLMQDRLQVPACGGAG